MAIAYIGLGSNLGHPRHQLKQAQTALEKLPETQLLVMSPIYQTPAVGGPEGQPDYHNGVAKLETGLQALSLLKELQRIEHAQQRVRTLRWGPRTLDLDLLLYDDSRIDLPELTVPHPRMQERAFVLLPLYDIAPGLHLPSGNPIAKLLAECNQDGIIRLE